jgi:SAM-dependent methyltransferase
MSAMKPIERFDPDLMGGSLLEAEHLARYRWAGALVEGKRVLDAGCGTGYGSELLAREGAGEVVGVDVDADVIDAASRSDSHDATFAVADLRELPADLGEFDVVVCFEVLEHIGEPEVALDSLASVLRPGGLLVVSSPNRDVYPPGNPFHEHEFTPEELAEALSARFAHVRLVRQQDWLAAALFDDDDFTALDALKVPVAKAVPGEAGKELYSVGLAGSSELPAVPPFVMLTRTADLRWWEEVVQGLRDELAATKQHVSELEAYVEQLSRAQAELEAMQATRLWRFGTRYWELRDRLVGSFRPRS